MARTNVLNILNGSQKIGMKALRILLPADVMWLYRHDRQWLKQKVEPVPTQKKSTIRVDWEARDMLMCQRIRNTIADLLRLPGNPTRVSLNELGRRTGHASWLEKKLDKLPKTRELLPRVLESVEAFQQRRYRWWQEKLAGTTIHGEATESQIRRAAGLPASFKPNQRC